MLLLGFARFRNCEKGKKSISHKPNPEWHSISTCNDTRHNGGKHRGLRFLVHAGEETEQQAILSHGKDYTGHGEHGAQQARAR